MTTPAVNTATTALTPEQLRDLELRAQAAHPDEAVASAREALALVRQVRDLDGYAVSYAMQADRVRELAREWIASPDIQQAATGRLLIAALDGRQALNGLI